MTIQWEDWMAEGGEMTVLDAKEPMRKLLAEWIVSTCENISKEMGHNAWKKKSFEWVVGCGLKGK
jgi:hypothetical protein